MPGSSLYFSEFLLRTKNGGERYYLPIIIDSENEDIAINTKNQIKEKLNSTFEEVKSNAIKTFNQAIYSEILPEETETKKNAQLCKINIENQKMESYGEEAVPLSNGMKIVSQNLQLTLKHNIYYHLEQSSILTTKVNSENDFDKDFLILKLL